MVLPQLYQCYMPYKDVSFSFSHGNINNLSEIS